MKLLLAVALVALCGSATAQNVRNVSGVVSQATMLMSEGSYNGCGMRFVGVALESANPRFPVYGWDFNVSLMRFDGSALAVVHKAEITSLRRMEELRSGGGVMKKIKRTWVQAEGRTAWKPFKTGIPGQNGLSSMSTYEAPEILDYLMAIAGGAGTPLLLGIQVADESAVRIYRFKPELAREDSEAFAACTKSLIEQAEQALPTR